MTTRDKAVHRALLSLLDVVEELCQGLAHGQQPEPEWAQIVSDDFAERKAELRSADG